MSTRQLILGEYRYRRRDASQSLFSRKQARVSRVAVTRWICSSKNSQLNRSWTWVHAFCVLGPQRDHQSRLSWERVDDEWSIYSSLLEEVRRERRKSKRTPFVLLQDNTPIHTCRTTTTKMWFWTPPASTIQPKFGSKRFHPFSGAQEEASRSSFPIFFRIEGGCDGFSFGIVWKFLQKCLKNVKNLVGKNAWSKKAHTQKK